MRCPWRQFDLEVLEARVMLSAAPLLPVSGAVSTANTADATVMLESASSERRIPQTSANTPAPVEALAVEHGLLDGVALVDLETPSPQPASGDVKVSTLAAAGEVTQGAALADTPTTNDSPLSSPDSVTAGNYADPDTSTLADQLTDTLRAANGPPEIGLHSVPASQPRSGAVGLLGPNDPSVILSDLPVWVSQGPDSINQLAGAKNTSGPAAGAVQVILPHPEEPGTMLLGTVNGGIWKTTNLNTDSPTWKAVTDDFPSLSIGAMASDPSAPNVVYAGTGAFSSFSYKGGSNGLLLKSINFGDSWKMLLATGLPESLKIQTSAFSSV